MATNFPSTPLLALLLLGSPAVALGQDASFGSMEEHTSSEQDSSSTTTTSSQSTTGQDQDGATSSDQNGDSAFGNFGSLNQQSTTSGSSHSESRSESRDSSVEIDMGGNDDDWPHGHDHGDRHGGRPGWGAELVGRWTLGQENGNTCTIELKDAEWFGGHSAYVPAGCPDGFFPANRWVLSGNQLLITDTNNTTIGRFRQDRSGRWSGKRESDGARLYLNPVGN